MAVRVDEGPPVGDGGDVPLPKQPRKHAQQVDLFGRVAHKVDELVAVVEHDVLVHIARPEDAVVEDEPLRMRQAMP